MYHKQDHAPRLTWIPVPPIARMTHAAGSSRRLTGGHMSLNIFAPHIRFASTASVLLGCLGFTFSNMARADSVDEMHLTDEPGNWFRSEATGTPVTIIDPGDRVDFKINNCCTNTRHTVTLLVKPDGSSVTMDQDSSQMGTLSTEFDVPGVYVLVCKVHPYMTAVVAVRDAAGNIPPVTATSLPFIAHLGAPALPA